MSAAANRILNTAFWLVLLILLGSGVWTYVNVLKVADTSQWVQHTRGTVVHLERMLALIRDAQAARGHFLLTGRPEFLQPYKGAVDGMAESMVPLELLTRGDLRIQRQRYEAIRGLASETSEELKQTMDRLEQAGLDPALQVVRSGRGDRILDEAIHVITELGEQEFRLLREKTDRTLAVLSLTTNTFLLATVTALVMLIAVAALKRGAEARSRNAVRDAELERNWLSTTLESLGDGVIATDAQGRVKFLNPVAANLIGWGQDEAKGMPIGQIYRMLEEETRVPLENPAEWVIRHGQAAALTNHVILVARGGSETPVEKTAAPIRDGSGATQGAVLVFRDVTQRREAHLALMRSERELSDFFENASVGLHLVGPDGTILRANRADMELLGYSREEYIGRNVAEFHTDQGLIVDILRRLQAGENLHDQPVKLRCKDGSVKDVLANSSVLWDAGKFIHARCFVRDVTDRLRVEDALRASEERFRSMAESISQLAWMARPDGYIYWFNKRTYDYTGLTLDELKGWDWQRVHDPEVLPTVLENWKKAVDRGEPINIEFSLRGVDGQYRPFLSSAVPVRDVNGKIAHWFGTHTDITELREVEKELRAAKDEAETANLAKTQFLSVLSHELRTPLNPVLLATSWMLDHDAPNESMRPTLEIIRENVNLQARLIDDLLDVMRIVQGKMPVNLTVVDVHQTIEKAVKVCAGELSEGKLCVRLDFSAPLHHVNGDPTRLQQVVWNLIKNAAKFTPYGGSVTVRTRNELRPNPLPPLVVIEVSDTGIGIESEVLPAIFDPFQQGERTITRKYGGLGLGLAICKGVVDAHGGTIVAESQGSGLGTTIRVVLDTLSVPVQLPRTDPEAQTVSRPARQSILYRILVVEDDPTTLFLMASLLRKLGHTVTTATKIAQAYETFKAGEFDLILSDIGLPDGTGLDLIRMVTAERPTRAIAVSGFGRAEDIHDSLEAGFTAHMTKPIESAKLEAMILQVMDGASSS